MFRLFLLQYGSSKPDEVFGSSSSGIGFLIFILIVFLGLVLFFGYLELSRKLQSPKARVDGMIKNLDSISLREVSNKELKYKEDFSREVLKFLSNRKGMKGMYELDLVYLEEKMTTLSDDEVKKLYLIYFKN